MMNEEEVRRIAHEAAKEAVIDTLQRLGFDTDSPQEVREDMVALRAGRKLRDKGRTAAMWVVVTSFVGGVMSAVWAMLKGGAK